MPRVTRNVVAVARDGATRSVRPFHQSNVKRSRDYTTFSDCLRQGETNSPDQTPHYGMNTLATVIECENACSRLKSYQAVGIPTGDCRTRCSGTN